MTATLAAAPRERDLGSGLIGLAHRGPRGVTRIRAVPGRILPFTGELRAGGVLMDEVARLFADNGCTGGVLWLDGTVCDPFRFVLPAYSADTEHAAFYSETHAPDGRVTILAATATVGRRDGGAFLHCHGIWTIAATGARVMGHVLPFDTVLATTVTVRAIGSPDTWFEGLADAETAFTLFTPQGEGNNGRGFFVRLLPDEDICTALSGFLRRQGIASARIEGIGSISHSEFTDGRRVACSATEVRIDKGIVTPSQAVIDVSLVDTEGAIHHGRLAAGRNPTGVTFEVLVVPD